MADRGADPGRLARIHRVREVQARLAQADEARASDKAAAETNLSARVAQLVAGVAPAAAPGTGASLQATAHFRERLHASAAAAAARLDVARLQLERSRQATRSALRDRTATEKLLERAQAEAARRADRVEPDAPAPRRERHDPC